MRKKAIFILAGMAVVLMLALPGCPSPAGGGGEPTAGGPDPTFHAPVLNSGVSKIVVLSDGSILIAGAFSTVNGLDREGIARLNADGSWDPSFPAGGTGPDDEVKALALLGDGRILIGGWFTHYSGTDCGRLVRLNADGSLDTAFHSAGAGLGADGVVYSIGVQTDGRIVIGGSFTHYSGAGVNYIARLGADGDLDTGFQLTGSGLNDRVTGAILCRSSGKILLNGSFQYYDTVERWGFAQLNADGSLDTGFPASGTGANATGDGCIFEQDAGACLIGGHFTTYNNIDRGRLARINADGTLDESFLATGSGADHWVGDIDVQGDGKILISGYFETYNDLPRHSVARLNADGSLDQTFLVSGFGPDDFVISIAIQSDGTILIGGGDGRGSGFLRRVLP